MKKILSIILAATIMLNLCANFVFAETQDNELWRQYTVFSGSDTENLSMSCWRSTINGGMYTGSDFIYNGSELYLNGICSAVGNITTNGWKMNIQNRQPGSMKLDMPDFGEKIKENAVNSSETVSSQQRYSANEINLSEPIISDGGISFDGTRFSGEGYIIAKDNITYNVSWLDTGDDYYSVIYSENGDIIINGSSITINGILYAPKGKVQFNVSTLNLNGRIVADSIVFSGSQFYITGNDGDWDWIDDKNNQPISKTYTLSSDFEEGEFDGIGTNLNDQLTLNSNLEFSQNATNKKYEFYVEDNKIDITEINSKEYITENDNCITVSYEFDGLESKLVNSRYEFVNEQLTWDKAKLACEEKGGHLAVITSQEEQDKIEELLLNGTCSAYWIGGTDESLDGDFTWVTGESFSYTNWGRSQPDNSYSNTEDYLGIARLNYSWATFGKWNDFRIKDSVVNGYICEWNDTKNIDVSFQTTIKDSNMINIENIEPKPAKVVSNDDGSSTLVWDDASDGIKIMFENICVDYMNVNLTSNNRMIFDYSEQKYIFYADDVYVSIDNYRETGSWSVVYDSEKDDTVWKNINWNGKLYDDGKIIVKVCAGNDKNALGDWINVENHTDIENLSGRYIQVFVEMSVSSVGRTPELFDITLLSEGIDDDNYINNVPQISIGGDDLTCVSKNLRLSSDVTDDAFCSQLRFEWSCDNENVVIDEANSPCAYFKFNEVGEYSINLTVSDGSSETNVNKTVTVLDDSVSVRPIIELELPDAVIAGSKVSGKVTNINNTQILEYQITIGDKSVSIDENNNFTFIAPNDDGIITVNAKATNVLGLCGGASKSVIIDSSAPDVEFKISKDEIYVNDTVTISVAINDAVGISDYIFTVDDKEIELGGNNEFIFTPTEAKTTTINIIVYDKAGNTTEKSTVINVLNDTKAPTVTLTTSADAINRGEAVTATVQATDNVAVEKIELYYNGEPIDIDKDGVSISQPKYSGTFTAKVYDAAGNVVIAEKDLIVKSDTTNPDIPEGGEDSEKPNIPEGGEDSEKPNIPEGGEDYEKPDITIKSNYVGEGTIYVPTETDIIVYLTFSDNVGVTASNVLLDGNPVTLDGNNSFTFNSGNAGIHKVTASAEDEAGNIGYAEAEFFAITGGASNAPEIAVTSPLDGETVRGNADITGTVRDDDLVKYELAYSESGKDEYTVFAEGCENIESGVLGTLDTTLINNGVYDIRLTAYDAAGGSASTVVSYIAEGALKIGNFSIGFDDMTIPVNGLPLTVTRTYDSRSRNTVGDFGYGWNMTLSNIKVEVTADIGADWYQMSDEAELTPTYMINEYRPHKIIVTYPDGQTDKFRITPNPARKTITPILDAQLTITAEDGTSSKLEFADDTETYFSQSGSEVNFLDASSMEIYNPKRFVLTTKEGVKYLLDADKGVEKITNTDGTTLTFTDSGITHSDGRSILFERDSENRITSITDPMGNSVKYGYDKYGDLTAVSDQMNNVVRFTYDENHYLKDIISADGVRVGRNEYDDSGRLTATIDADGNRIEYTHNTDDRCEIVKDRLGNQTVYYYDADGNVTKTVDAYGNETAYTYDAKGNKLTETDALGNITSYTYDASGNMNSLTNAEGITASATYDSYGRVLSVSDISKDIMRFEYDSTGNITSQTDSTGNVTEFSYDESHRMTGISDKIGTTMSITYDKSGNVASMKDAAGALASFSYDENGRCTSRTLTRETADGTKTLTDVYTYDANGNVIAVADSEGKRTTAEYNSFGKISSKTDNSGNRTEYSYDNFGNLVKVLYPDNTTETFTYDIEGNNTSSTNRSGMTVNYKYDKLGRLSETVYPNGASEKKIYDSVGRVVKEISVTGAATEYGYDKIGRNTSVTDTYGNVTTYAYNNSSNIIESVDPKGSVYKMEYDANGNRTKTILPDGSFTETAYDSRGRVTSVSDQMGYTASYEYDNADNLTKVKLNNGASWSYKYDTQNNLIEVIDANGNSTKYEYDDFARLTKTTLPLGMSKTQSYDENGNLVSVTDFNGNSTSYSYDNMNQITKVTYSDGTSVDYTYNNGVLTSVTDSNGTMQYTYDNMGMLDKKTLYDGTVIDYDYDAACNVSKITTPYSQTSYEYDLLGRITKVVDSDGHATLYEYDANGNRTAVRHANGMITTYEYDSLNRLILETIKDSEGNTAQWYKYTLDTAGNRTKAEEYTGAVYEYEYDDCYRLVKENIVDGEILKVIEYTYDNMYNRISKTEDDTVTAYEYDANNRLIRQGEETLEYDNNGNLIRQYGGVNERTYTYNHDNRLVKAVVVQENNILSEEYEYDCEGSRISKTTNEVDVTKYIVDSNTQYANVLAELDGNGNVKCVYTHGNEIISQKRNGTTSFYLFDGHGNTRMLADADGNITDTYDYDAFGNLINKTGETENSYLYCGEQYDGTTGYYYLRARYMNPHTGTFVTMDTYQGAINDPVSLHKYLYANANPVMNIDPSGNTSSVLEVGVTLAVASVVASAYCNMYFKRLNTLYNSARTEIISDAMCGLRVGVQEILMYVGGWEYTKMLVNEYFYAFSVDMLLICSVADQIIKQVKTVSKEASGDKKYEGVSVYTLMKEDRPSEVYYVGISNDPIRRKREHERKEEKKTGKNTTINMNIVASGLSRPVARAYEHILICTYTKDALKNARYEIAKNNYDKFAEEINRVAELLKLDSPDSLKNDILDY